MSAIAKLDPGDFKNPHIKKFIEKLPETPKFYYDVDKRLTSVNFADSGCIDEFLEKTVNSNGRNQYANYLFYKKAIKAKMILNGKDYDIDEVHNIFTGGEFSAEKLNYAIIESQHSFIQWLFPLHEGTGMNGSGANSALLIDEAELMMSNPTIMRRFYFSYKIMMKYYELDVDDYTYEVTYNKSELYVGTSHNEFRTSRIIKSLDYLGMEHLVVPTILGFFYRGMDSTLISGQQYVKSVIEYGCMFVRNKFDQDELLKVAKYILSNNIE